MTECEKSGQVPKIISSYPSENRSRAFRLRPINTTERLGRKYSYLKSSILKCIAGIQLTLAIGLVLIQVSIRVVITSTGILKSS